MSSESDIRAKNEGARGDIGQCEEQVPSLGDGDGFTASEKREGSSVWGVGEGRQQALRV